MFRHYILLIALSVPGAGFAQGLINNGARIVVGGSSNIYINGSTGNYTNQNSGLITSSAEGGKITLQGNWVNNAANTAFSNDGATIVLGGSSGQTIGGSNGTAFYKLTATGGGTKTVNTASTISKLLTLEANTIFNANDKTTLLATTSTNANVAAIPSSSSVTGNMKVQTYFTGGGLNFRGSRLVAAPVNETGSPKNTYSQLKDYIIITGIGGASKGFDPGGQQAPNAATLSKYYEPGTATSSYTDIANITDPLSPGYGVLVYYRGDRTGYTPQTALTSLKTNAPFMNPESALMVWNGPINQGDLTINLSYTSNPTELTVNGYNLIGNPYPAYINWDLVTRNNVKNVLRFIKPGGGFSTYDGTINNGTSVNAPAGGDLRYIAPGQGFYTKALGVGASVTFTENAKAVGATSIQRLLYNPKEDKLLFNGMISAAPASTPSISAAAYKLLRMNIQDDWNKDETIALFAEGETAAATEQDVNFMGGSTVALATLSSDNVRMTINRMPSLNDVSEMKLYVASGSTGNVKLNFTDLSAVQNYNVYLKDAYLGKTVDVKANPTYEFTIDVTVSATYGNNRMSLLFTPATTLPIALSSLKAERVASGARITWSVKSEENVARYDLERSADGSTFTRIKEVTDLGKSTYSVIDESPALGKNYYRLKSVDADGRLDSSYVVSLDYALINDVNVNVFPNPASDIVKVKLPSAKATTLAIFDLSGKKLKSGKFNQATQVQENISDLQEGIYVIEVRDSETNTMLVSSKFVVKK